MATESEKANLTEPIDLQNLEAFTQGLKAIIHTEEDPEVKTLIMQKIVDRIIVTKDGIEIHFSVGKDHFKRKLGFNPGSRPSSPASPTDPGEAQKTHSDFFSDSGSISLTNGSGDANLVEPIVVVREYPGQWIKRLKPVDLAELARLRWIEKWPVKRLAIHFERHRGTISEMLASLKTDAKRRSKCT